MQAYLITSRSTCLFQCAKVELVIDLSSGVVQYINAGHTPIIHQTVDEFYRHESNSTPVGMMPIGIFIENSFVFNKDDRLLLFTDGFIEGSHSTYREVLTKIEDHLRNNQSREPETIFTYLLEKQKESLNFSDDITIVHINRK